MPLIPQTLVFYGLMSGIAFGVFEGVQYVSIGSASGTVQYAQVLNGTRGSDPSNKLQINFATGKNYTQVAGKNSSGQLKIWVPADMVPAA